MLHTPRGVLAVGLATLLTLCLALPSPVMAARDAEVSLMDDQLFLNASTRDLDTYMDLLLALGVDRVRVSAFWNTHAPAPQGTEKPPDFDATDPSSPGYDWTALDRVVSAASSHGLRVMVSLTTPAPFWATAAPQRRNPVERPIKELFADYAEAVARRYAREVDHYGILNEPNQGAWLQPQSDSRGLASPHIYRELVQAAYPRIKAADPSSTALIGELSSSGTRVRGTTSTIRPLTFLREMGCRDRRLRPVRFDRCSAFSPVPGDAIGHHPYSLLSRPSVASRHPDDVAIGDAKRLIRLLDQLTAVGALTPGDGPRLDVFYTEFGYQTDPPDPFAGISLAQQAQYLQEAAYETWRSPRIRSLNQFRLTDGPVVGSGRDAFREFQSGLMFEDRRPKPAIFSFADPIFLAPPTRRGGRALLWGQVRAGEAHDVTVDFRPEAGGGFREVMRLRTDRRGYFSRRVPTDPGLYRYRYDGRDGPGVSVVARLRRR